jgi:hypothetical protein
MKYVRILSILSILAVGYMAIPNQHRASFGGMCYAQDLGNPTHPTDGDDPYVHWMMPDHPTTSCCHMRRVNENGAMVGDCGPTDMRWDSKTDTWYAKLPNSEEEIAVPKEKIIREHNPDPTGIKGHLCFNERTYVIYCAVTPTGAF